MNGIDAIAGKITGDAQREAESILAAARDEARAIGEKYEAQARVEAEKIKIAGEEQAKEIRRRAAFAAEQDAKRQLLGAKQRLIAQAFDGALAKLLALPENEYVSLLARLAAQAADRGDEEIVMSPKEKETRGRQVTEEANRLLAKAGKRAGLKLSSESRAFAGGLVLKAGDVEVNCALDTILRLSKDDLALDVAAALFA
ncbi:MAG: hypothetical protein LBK98_06835 [Peptococcaceae bacterium]|jgi:V/A-type H+-transporting ATPase subunit E|nr:hypothetical protein [Peptococcaceae bacterium]